MNVNNAGRLRRNGVGAGQSAPIGATVYEGGVNFSIYSRTASGIDLLLFDHVDDGRPSRVISLDRRRNHTHHYWHCYVPGLAEGQLYGYRAQGVYDPSQGRRFDSAKLLLDPYGRGVATPGGYDREAARRPGDNTATAMKSVVVDPRRYDWEGDAPLRRSFNRTVIYEMHVRGFTRHPSAGALTPGWWRRSPTCSNWAFRRSSCCRSLPLIPTTRPPGW
jgi:glycogen operon protein